ncbi:microtubule-associated protein futsch-like isoform X2 [Biomphalaria glabrata]|uniref:Microtubule-associated protein futsch-like isoform X2 n=1 Tax=Biomphalaria glabrata TaxID=6526 RepID=A0A9W2ZC07_BIOGL|nr:microtubule-associated protein futsch-like isoform X2 [Biomphalaria glabrata]
MSDNEDPQKCVVCSVFEPQAWRKSLCRNCFHSLEEHSEELLAQEAEAVAKEKDGEAPAVSKPSATDSSAPQPDASKSKEVASKASKGGPAPEKDIKAKPTAGKEEIKTPSSKEASSGKEAVKLSPKSSFTVAMVSGKSKTVTSTPTPATSSPSKSPPKTTVAPSSSTASSLSTTTTTSLSSSTSSTSTTSTSAQKTTSVSLAKNFASKFESKAASLAKEKSPSKFPDTRGGGPSVSVVTGKISSDPKADSKSSSLSKPTDTKSADTTKPSDSKTADSTKVIAPKVDTKNLKNDEGEQSSPKTSTTDSKTNISPTKDESSKNTEDKIKSPPSDLKDKKQTSSIKADDKDTKSTLASRSKSAPFGKDLLKSKKDSVKKEQSPVKDIPDLKSKENGANKAKTPVPKSLSTSPNDKEKSSTSSKPTTSKTADDKTKKNGDNSTIKTSDKLRQGDGSSSESKSPSPSSRSSQGPEQTDSAAVNKNAHPAKPVTGKTGDNGSGGQTSGPADGSIKTSDDVKDPNQNNKKDTSPKASPAKSDRDKSSPYRDRGKDEGSGAAKKGDNLSPPTGKPGGPPTSKTLPLSASKSASKLPFDKIKDTKLDSNKDNKSSKVKELDKSQDKTTPSLKTQQFEKRDEATSSSSPKKGNEKSTECNDNDLTKRLTEELKEKAEALSSLNTQLTKMEEKIKSLELEKEKIRKESAQTVNDDLEKLLKELRSQICGLEGQCSRLEKDNQDLLVKLREKDSKNSPATDKKHIDNSVLEEDLEAAEKELEEVKEENKDLQSQIMEMRNEMDEMYDHFREAEHDEFRELQKELDLTAKNCRILQFKLRKAERRNDQIEEDRIHYEEKLRRLQDQFDSQDAKNHIRVLEEELRMAKEVSVRLHDELDIVEDKRNKTLEENRHLTELLEHTDKRQFRMEMEIDKLRDIVSDLRQQLKEAKGNNNKESTSPDRKPPLGAIGKQGSKEYDVSQLMKDLCDTMERENDLRDQLKFTEEESKMLRKRVSSMDEENEYLRLQLQKMSEKASKHKKKEKERQRELEEEKKHTESIRAALGSSGLSDDVILIVGADGNDIIDGDEPIPVSQRKDSTDEDLMNVMQLRVQLEMVEQELMTSHKKLDDMDLENENLQAEVKFLQERLAEKEAASTLTLAEPSTPNAYYEDKLRELSQEADDLRWKLIEKDREIERLSVVQTRHIREHVHHKKDDKLKKSKSLDTDTEPASSELRRQVDSLQIEIIRLRQKLEETEEKIEELQTENEDLKNRTPVPSVRADDAPLENIDLREKVRKLEEENKAQADKIKLLTDNLQRLSRDSRTFTSSATSPTTPGKLGIPGIPLFGPGILAARADSEPANRQEEPKSRAQQQKIQFENAERKGITVESPVEGNAVEISSEKREYAKPLLVSTAAPSSTSTRGVPGDLGGELRIDASFSITEVSSTREYPLRGADEGLRALEAEPGAKEFYSQHSLDHNVRTESKGHMEKAGAKTEGAKGGGGGGGGSNSDYDRDSDEESEASVSRRRIDSDDEPIPRSILLDYPEFKSKVAISGEESRVELMEKVLDMDDEISVLLNALRERESLTERLLSKTKYLKMQLRELKEDSRRTELELLQELDMLHDKNSVMSNLLDIINERAEAAEEELERRVQETTTHSPARSASNVSQVSALSDTSMGSDEVFLTAHSAKEGVITRDWEGKLKVRIESLERLLAEERQKVSMMERKLLLAGIDTTAPSVSDDVKLRMREKEMLQEELLKSQRHLHIATDQIQGLKERIDILEEERQRLKEDYGKLYDEVGKSHSDEETQTVLEPTTSTSLETPLLATQTPKLETQATNHLLNSTRSDPVSMPTSELMEQLVLYKAKAKELEFKVEEINDTWNSKSHATDKEKEEHEQLLEERNNTISKLQETIENLKSELCAKVKVISEFEVTVREKELAMSKQEDLAKEQEVESKRLESDHQTLLNQISQRDITIRGLNESIRIRDERLREKDDILFKLNSTIDEHKKEMKHLGEKLLRTSSLISEKDAAISVLRGQISSSSVLLRDTPASCQTDAEKESFRLKEALNSLQLDHDHLVNEKKQLEATLEKSRQALDEAMLMWDRERNDLQREANILEEKVRMYEAYNTMGKDETIETLKEEAQGYFNEKEALVCELSTLRLKHESSERVNKEQMAKLQAELTDKLRLLKMEVDSSSHMTTEMERLRRQAEMAYRLQQEQRVMKAEQLAMKVRYETRIDKMSKEQDKMLLTIEKLQKERELDKQIIQGIQNNLSLVKDKYTEELLRSEEDKTALDRQLKEIEESRGHIEELQRHVRDLREKTSDQDRLRAELINRFATDRASWEIEKANFHSQINQLEEQLTCTSRQQERSKDIQVNMGMAWEKERREQRRLLGEAHTLALDLQEQLRAREETAAHERKELIRQMESDRLTFAKMTRETEKKMLELESSVRNAATLQKRMKETQDKCDKESELWRKEKTDLLRLLAESRHSHNRDIKAVEDVLSSLIRLRELGMMLNIPSKDNIGTNKADLDQDTLDFVREAVLHICRAADELTNITNQTTDEGSVKTICSSEVDLLKSEFCDKRHVGNDVFVIADVVTTTTTRTTRIEEESKGVTRLVQESGTHQKSTSLDPMPKAQKEFASASEEISSNREKDIAPVRATEVPVTLRNLDKASPYHERPPSYSSGSRSAQNSRATTPEVPESSPVISNTLPSRKSGLPTPPPSYVIPSVKFPISYPSNQTKPLTSVPSSASTTTFKPKRPVTFLKSLSVDSAPLSPQVTERPEPSSLSANNTPNLPVTCSEMISSLSTSAVISSPSEHFLSVSGAVGPRSSSFSHSTRDRFSPRTARRKFFEELTVSSTTPAASSQLGYQSWPERRSVSSSLHLRQQSLPDPNEVRREAEEEHSLVVSKLEPLFQKGGIRTSASWDDQMHFSHFQASMEIPSAEASKPTPTKDSADGTQETAISTIVTSTTSSSTISKHGAKEKRKFFKKSCSLDSTIGSTIASVGVSVMPPAAPTGFTPADIFAAVKGKLKPVFKKKTSGAATKTNEVRPPSPLFIQTEVPDVHFTGHTITPISEPLPEVDVDPSESLDQESKEYLTELPFDRSRETHRNQPGKWRSRSADRITSSTSVPCDVIRPVSGVWKFNETAV